MASAAEAHAHRARGRWRWLALAGALGLLVSLIIGEGTPAHVQAKAGVAPLRASVRGSTAQRQLQPTDQCSPPDCDPTRLTTGGTCSVEQIGPDAACYNLVTELQQWTRWAAWLLGGFAVLWILTSFYRSSEPFVGHSAEGPWRRIWLRVVEGAAVFLIAWRIGDVAATIEGILWANHTENVQLNNSIWNTTPGLVGPPQHAIAQLLGLATATLVQVFFIYLLPRVVVQIMIGIGMVVSGRFGASFPPQAVIGSFYLSIIESVLQLLALGVAIYYAPTVLIWIFTALTG